MGRVRVGAIIKIEKGFALMHRTNVKHKTPSNYHTFPGGGVEKEESLEQAVIREVEEELGIQVKVEKLLYEHKKNEQKEYFYLCKYISGEFGTGTGPEFSNNPEYISNGNYIPEIIKREDIEKIILLPPEIREAFIKDINKNNV